MALSAKQQQFISEYLQCWNATEAARRAGYSDKTAAAIGWENLRKPEIAEVVNRSLDESAMSAKEALMRLAEQARGDIGEFLVEGGDSITVDLVAMKAAKKTRLIKKITQIRRRRTTKDSTEEEITTSLELYDAQAAQQLIGKHHGVFEKDDAGGEVVIPIMMVQPGLLAQLKP